VWLTVPTVAGLPRTTCQQPARWRRGVAETPHACLRTTPSEVPKCSAATSRREPGRGAPSTGRQRFSGLPGHFQSRRGDSNPGPLHYEPFSAGFLRCEDDSRLGGSVRFWAVSEVTAVGSASPCVAGVPREGQLIPCSAMQDRGRRGRSRRRSNDDRALARGSPTDNVDSWILCRECRRCKCRSPDPGEHSFPYGAAVVTLYRRTSRQGCPSARSVVVGVFLRLRRSAKVACPVYVDPSPNASLRCEQCGV
jgi:hypothetical protein